MAQLGHMRAPSAATVQGLPHTLRYSLMVPAFLAFFALLFGFFASAADREPSESGRLRILVIFGVLAATCAVGVVHTLVRRVRLEADRAIAFGLLGRHELLRSDIAGYRRSSAGSRLGPSVLVPATAGLRAIALPPGRKTDPVLNAWINGFADLTPRLEPPPVIWEGPMATLKRVSLGLNLLAIAAGAWTALWPHPDPAPLLVAAVVPWLGIAAARVTWGAVAFDRPRGQSGPSAGFVLLWPTLGLVIRPVIDFEIFDWMNVVPPMLIGAALGVGGFGLLFPWMRAGRPYWWAGPALFGVFYAFGVFTNGDRAVDLSPPRLYQAQVLDKTISRGRSTSYNLKLGPWGPRVEGESVSVRYDVFESVHIGGRACIDLHRGGFGMRWYKVHGCD